MKPLTTADIVDIAQYERERPTYRPHMTQLKKHRRVQIGDIVTFVFENRDTVRFQIQEMMRAERIVMDDRIRAEVDIYNELIPAAGQLSATGLIEITDQANLRDILDTMIGLDRGGTTFLVIGDDRIEAVYEGGQSNEVRISAVHYLTFDLTPEQSKAIAPGGPQVSIVIEHPNYHAEQVLSDDVRASLATDFVDV
ncbi:MAG: DUF3501 family protein [Chloroflexi bacterium]|nr:DUF3501 family protein [Chloroflexota bacterium]MDA1173866.1 DUF3501 family protein [Chloroflexota bacterium]